MAFNIGDRVKIIKGGCVDEIYTISGWKLVKLSSINKSIMSNLKEKFLLAIATEPQKSFRKKGITNGDNMLTSDGTELFLNWLFKQNQDKFKTEVVDLIEEEKE